MRILLYFFMLLGLVGVGGNSYGQNESVGFRDWFLISDPSNERSNTVTRNDVRRGWLCVGGRGRLFSTCPVDFELFDSSLPIAIDNVVTNCLLDASRRAMPGTCADGGHRHQDPTGTLLSGKPSDRPDLYRVLDILTTTNDEPPFEDVRYPQDTDSEPRTITGGFTGGGFIRLDNAFTWSVPHVGGIYAFKSTMRPPGLRPTAKFVEFFGGFLFLRDRLEARGELNVTYQRDSLKQLPAMPTLYSKERGGDSLHDDSLSYAAQDKTIQALGVIGFLFKKIDGRTISYNDISLPKGGVFDWDTGRFPWRDTHATHRMGLDIDINKPRDATGTAERCDFNTTVQAAIDVVLTGVPRKDGSNTALLCENLASGFRKDPGTYHLEVTNFKINPSFAAALKALQQGPGNP